MRFTKKRTITRTKRTKKGGYQWRTTPIKKNRRIKGRGRGTRKTNK